MARKKRTTTPWNEILREKIELSGMKSEAVAVKAGVSLRTVFRWLDGEAVPPVSRAVLIAYAVGCSLDEIWTTESLGHKESKR